MKVLSLKALAGALLTSTLFFNANIAIAEPTATNTVTKEAATQQIVHLNKSTLDDLVTLKGIGQKKAQAILAYRKQAGDFKSINDLTKVKGVGVKVLIDNQGRLKI